MINPKNDYIIVIPPPSPADGSVVCLSAGGRLGQCSVNLVRDLYAIFFNGYNAPFLYQEYRKAGYCADGGNGLYIDRFSSFFKNFGFLCQTINCQTKDQFKAILNSALQNKHYLIVSTGEHIYAIQPYTFIGEDIKFCSPSPIANAYFDVISPASYFKEKKDFCICLNALFHIDHPADAFLLKDVYNFSIVSTDIVWSKLRRENILEVKGIKINFQELKKRLYKPRCIEKIYRKHAKLRKKRYDYFYKEFSEIMNHGTIIGSNLQQNCYKDLQKVFQVPMIGKEYKKDFDKNLPTLF